MKTAHCVICDKEGHYAYQCFMKEKKPLKSTRHLRSQGKYARRWATARKLWVKNNPPDHAGFWYCTYCGTYLTSDTLTIDHKLARSGHPELRYEQSNLVPCCYPCNSEKGSGEL